MDKYQALHSFWSGFCLVAYDENTVPATAEMPYITYQAVGDTFDGNVLLSASVWYHSMSWEAISQKVEEISGAIGLGGSMTSYTGGALWVKRSSPFAQRMSDPDKNIRRILLSVEVEYLSEN